jgi:hypothetical protein
MRKIIIFALINFLFVANIYAYEWFTPLSDSEIKKQIGYTIITMIDWWQTKQFVADGIRERNPYLGPKPSQQRIDTLISVAIVGDAFVAWAIPKEFRPDWQHGSIIVESAAVLINCKNGYCLKLEFKFGF